MGKGILLVFFFLLAISCTTLQGNKRSASAPQPPAVKLIVTGPEKVIHNTADKPCGGDYAFGRSVRAIRNARGDIHLVSTAVNWQLLGKAFDDLRADCRLPTNIKKFGKTFEKDTTKDFPWFEAIYTTDGETIHAITGVGRQKEGEKSYLPGASCPRYALTFATSRDGGLSYQYSTNNDPTITEWPIKKPLQFDRCETAALDTRLGTTNILKRGDYYYTIAHLDRENGEMGNCLIRTKDLTDPSSWRGWDGQDFNAQINEQAKPNANRPCQLFAFGGEPERPARSISWHEKSGQYIAIIRNAFHTPEGKAADRAGFFYATSPDLIHWSDVELLLSLPPVIACKTTIFYPSLIDPNSKGYNFEEVGDTGYVFGLRGKFSGCDLRPEREFVMIPVKIEMPKQ